MLHQKNIQSSPRNIAFRTSEPIGLMGNFFPPSFLQLSPSLSLHLDDPVPANVEWSWDNAIPNCDPVPLMSGTAMSALHPVLTFSLIGDGSPHSGSRSTSEFNCGLTAIREVDGNISPTGRIQILFFFKLCN